MCDPELLACPTPCPDWSKPTTTDSTVGKHDGHCCFLRDGHTTPPAIEDWRTGDDECSPPADTSACDEPTVTEPPC